MKKRIMITVEESDWVWFKTHHICLSAFIQDAMRGIIPIADKRNQQYEKC